VYATYAPGDATRLYVVEQGGKVKLAKSGVVNATPFLDVSSSVLAPAFSEQGLLGLAFDPSYATSGRFWIHYTQSAPPTGPTGDIIIAEYQRSAGNPDLADAAPIRQVIQVSHPTDPNHNGGMLAFGPDGKLYAGVGDGGSHAVGTSQSLGDNRGKILRFDPNNPGTPPAGNQAGFIWDWGLRNPWRFSFDRQTGDLYIGDVGEISWEEVDYEPSGQGKKNYGWNITEGNHCRSGTTCNMTGIVPPVAEYPHSGGDCAVIGGYVYRGSAISCLRGRYVYGDNCTKTLRSFVISAGAATSPFDLSGNIYMGATVLGKLASFGEDPSGELLYVQQSGKIYRLDPG
jgi:glucose/arabinose dehydrogenase